MSAFRFSRRYALSPRVWVFHGLDSKRVTIGPTRPEGTIKGEQQEQEEEEEEERKEQRHHLDDQFFLPLWESSLYLILGHSNLWARALYSSIKPPEGLMYSGQLNQLLKPQGASLFS